MICKVLDNLSVRRSRLREQFCAIVRCVSSVTVPSTLKNTGGGDETFNDADALTSGYLMISLAIVSAAVPLRMVMRAIEI